MEIRNLMTGSWFPRTKLHLKEYFVFLRTGTSLLPLDARTLKTARHRLAPADVAYIGGRFDKVSARLDGFAVDYFEDGLLTIGKRSADAAADIAALRRFYEDKMVPALSLIYSLGTPVITPGAKHRALRPVIALSDRASDQEASAFAASCGESVHYTARCGETAVHYADNLIIIAGGSDDFTRRLAGLILLFREYEHKLQHFLGMHRSVWEDIEKLRDKQSLTLNELPGIRDRLLDYQRDFSILRARLNQMDTHLDERQNEADASGTADDLRALETYRFGKLRSATRYIDRLWEMLEDYLSSTVEITGLMYQENLRREINIQQFIFLLGSVATILALGAMPGSNLSLFSPEGGLLSTGKIAAFSLVDLAKMGGVAILATLIVFAGIRPLVSNLNRIKTESLLGPTQKKGRGETAD